MLFYHSPVTGSQLFLTGSQLIFPGSEPCSTLPKCIQVNMISLMSAKMKKKHQKMDKKSHFLPLSSITAAHCSLHSQSQAKRSKTKNQNNNCVSKQKRNEYLRIPVTRVTDQTFGSAELFSQTSTVRFGP